MMIDIDKERAAFERHALQLYPDVYEGSFLARKSFYITFSDGYREQPYAVEALQNQWEGWRYRAAIAGK